MKFEDSDIINNFYYYMKRKVFDNYQRLLAQLERILTIMFARTKLILHDLISVWKD